MAIFTYDITSPEPADVSSLPRLHAAHPLEVYTSDQSNEQSLHLLPMLMPASFFSASGDRSKDAESEVFADFSELPSTVSDFDDINWDEWILFDPPPIAPPPSLSDFSDNPIGDAHPNPSDVAPLTPDDRGGTSKEPGQEHHMQVHQSEEGTSLVINWKGDVLEILNKQEYIILPLSQVKILKLVYKRDGDEMYQIVGWIEVQEPRGYGTQGKPWKYSGSAEDPIIIDEPMSPLSCGSNQFIAIPFLQRNIERVLGGYKVYAKMTLDDLQEHGGLKLLAVYYSSNNECHRTRSRGLCGR
ncbi:hypothetical protein ACJ72_07927 [Emergomyces africanus]|uniref:Uncharacterized protein n=1 Tax=Emergomyces africanus TaxID=1955775 RepID=A0A1B7NMG2_9EURO|nr:hypothetical protein ACJ72_07927 [Emergomyces africanus]